MTKELTIKPEPLAVQQEPSIAMILSSAVQGGITKDNVEVVERLIALQKEMRSDEDRREFARALATLQSECQPVAASKSVPGNDGTVRYKYAPFEGIMKQVSPLLARNGFSVTFDTDIADGRVTVTCTLMHVSGHAQANKFACRIGKGPPASSEAQGDGAATTYAKRFALCAALNIVVEQDTDGADDARNVGEVIDWQEADELRERVANCGADEKAFLQFAGATKFEDIQKNRLVELKKMLATKEAKNRA
jgi:hypothetical protein